MAKTGIPELQAGLYQLLNGALSCDFYDAVPEETDYPYAAFLDMSSLPGDADKNADGRELIANIVVFSDKLGFKEAGDIAEEIAVLLGDAGTPGFSISGFQILYWSFITTVYREPDGSTRNAKIEIHISVY